MGTALLIDASPLMYAVANTPVGSFTTSRGEPTGLRFGLLRSIRSYTEQTKADKTVICYDTSDPVVKAVGYEEYKSNRTWTPEKEAMYSQVSGLKDLLSLTKYAQIEAAGYEADDVIGCVARKLAAQGHDVLIVTPDNDMLQLIWDPKIRIWMPAQPKKGHKKPWYKDEEYIHENYGVSSQELLLWRAIEGDKSDNLDGVDWNKLERLHMQKLLAKHASGHTITEPLGMDDFDYILGQSERLSPLWLSPLRGQESRKVVERNYKVMSLMDPPNLVVIKGKADSLALTIELERLEMKSLLRKVDDFTGKKHALASG